MLAVYKQMNMGIGNPNDYPTPSDCEENQDK
jgi:hypothetical protein